MLKFLPNSGVICSCFPGDSDSKESPCNVGDQSSIPESGRFSGEGNDSVQFSHSVMFDSLGPYGLQHARLPCPSPAPRAYSNSCPWSRWCHPTISSSVIPFSSRLQSFPGSGSFPKYWSFTFSISPSNEYSGLISFRLDWLGILAVQRILKSLLQHHNSKASILRCSTFFIVQLSHPYMTTGKTIFWLDGPLLAK